MLSFPSWERGLKLTIFGFVSAISIPSFPSWERGLKRFWSAILYAERSVVPLVGTWIETICGQVDDAEGNVSFPSWERGLKRFASFEHHLLIESFPSWERGLKPGRWGAKWKTYWVVPLVGTWIETSIVIPRSFPSGTSFPSWERGLKHMLQPLLPASMLSFPSWERGLKLPRLPRRHRRSSRSPRGNVD